MYRLILFWLPTLSRKVELTSVFVILAWLSLLIEFPWGFTIHLGAVTVITVLAAASFWGYYSQLFRFAKASRDFRRLDSERITIWYAPSIESRDPAVYLPICEAVLDEFNAKFGIGLKRRLVIFLFDSVPTLNRLFKGSAGGYALVGGDAAVLGFDGLVECTLTELLRHEVSHLFAWRLGDLDPPLKGEGLATFLQGTYDNKPIDFHALAAVLAERYPFLTWLAVPGYFQNVAGRYAVAGSFTAYLIQHFGWDRYIQFFRRATVKNFDGVFCDAFGTHLLTAENEWRDRLLARRQEFEPELSRFIEESNLMAAFDAWQLLRCLEIAQSLRKVGPLSGRMLWYVSAAHRYLHQYAEAIQSLELALHTDDSTLRPWAGSAWLMLGKLYDLMHERARAISAYERALAEPDIWSAWCPSSHTLARVHMLEPFNETDMQEELRAMVL